MRRNEQEVLWLPNKGEIYAMAQNMIQENDKDPTKKVKVTSEDALEFPFFIDHHSHQADIVKVLKQKQEKNRLSHGPNNSASANIVSEFTQSNANPCASCVVS